MKTQERREDETVTIFAGLILLLLVVTVGALVLVLAHALGSLSGGALDAAVDTVLVCAVAVSVGYVHRHRR